jgi:mannosyltransferase OCH1-like enzyme
MILFHAKLLVILLLLLLQAYAFIMPDGPWTLPVFPTQINVNYSELTDVPLDILFNGKRIPRILWTSMKDNPPKSFDQMSPHYQTMHQKNAANNWTFIFCDNNCVDNFFEKHWKGTKTYWVYKSLNRDIGVQAADLWRYCALWYYGGFYLDDDSIISKALDSCIHPEGITHSLPYLRTDSPTYSLTHSHCRYDDNIE